MRIKAITMIATSLAPQRNMQEKAPRGQFRCRQRETDSDLSAG